MLSQTSTSTFATTSTSYSDLPNASQTVTVPTGETDKLVVFFSGESVCYGGSSLERCRLKILVDNNEISPAAGDDAAFDNNDRGRTGDPATFDSKTSGHRATRSVVRVSGNLSAGSHTVKVQHSSTDSSTAFQLDNWALVVQRVKVS